jgi:hypothetical protein
MTLDASSQQTSLTAYASAFGLDAPVGGTIERGGWNTYPVGTQSAPEDPHPDVQMIPFTEGICYFRKITGNFDGGGEHVQILKDDGHWTLQAKGACTEHDGLFGGGACNARKNVQATATCYKFDQSN